MLRIGLTGGIGSGKSTVSGLLAAHGAVVIDADRIAREVVEPGSPGLAAIRERFGAAVVTSEGVLDRAALGAIVFADPESRRALEAITHPLIRARTLELAAQVPPETVVVHDIPLLVETGAAPGYHLVVVVDVDAEERVRRLVAARGMAEADARARVAHQATREQRLAAADVVLDNNGVPEALVPQVDRLWRRLVEFDERLRSGEPPAGPTDVVPADPTWSAQADRAIARLAHRLEPLLGEAPVVAHVGPTAVPGLAALDLLHLQVGLPSAAGEREDVRTALERLGHPRASAAVGHPAVDDVPFEELGSVHLWCDPGRPVVVHLRAAESDGWRTALLARDWLRGSPSARQELEHSGPATRHDADGYPSGWWASVAARAEDWAASTGWVPRS